MPNFFTGIARQIFYAFLPVLLPCIAYSQEAVLHIVDPFIGTGKSNVYTRWGNEGGTYPGAVSPWGNVQLSPETRSTGYDYKDSAILYFTCTDHHSGFPAGSTGRIHIMPVKGDAILPRPFLHQHERASPGYYKVELEDNHTIIEATTTTRCGWMRFRFPKGVKPVLLINDAGNISVQTGHKLYAGFSNTVFVFDKPLISNRKVGDGLLLEFETANANETVVDVQISHSTVDHKNAEYNLDIAFAGKSFDQIKKSTEQLWMDELSAISIDDSSENNKTVFYTALYHAMLLPWVISDEDHRYRGADKQIHEAISHNEYGGFSPWDTYRSLHPLLTLIKPERQQEMLSSMLHQYEQAGHLPIESMTGNHSIPIIVDSYLKGIKPADSLLLYNAMKKSIVTGPFLQNDFALYANGFVPHPHTESVTRTVEYTYDDWALAQFAKQVMQDDSLYLMLMKRSRNYRNLFDANELSLLPRKDNKLYHGTANAGYKEGDQWVYTLALPHHQRDLINLLGGDDHFMQHVEKAFRDRRIVFDNETMFHVPYLFNSTTHAYKTAEWVDTIRKFFTTTPGGLPGNDDLGSTSAWFVWSAMGLYPVCAGNPVYAIGSPLFKKMSIHLENEKQLVIEANNFSPQNIYVQSVSWNGVNVSPKWIKHATIANGGKLVFTMGNKPVLDKMAEPMPGDEDGVLSFDISGMSVDKNKVKPGEIFYVKYQLTNKSSSGTAIVKLVADDSIIFEKHRGIYAGETTIDSIPCRLYAFGKHHLLLQGVHQAQVDVMPVNPPVTLSINDFQSTPVVKQHGNIYCRYTVKNIGGIAQKFVVPVHVSNAPPFIDTLFLKPGDSSVMYHSIPAIKTGVTVFSIGKRESYTKVFAKATDALVLQLPQTVYSNKQLKDISGFHNDGVVSEPGNFIELPHTASLDSNGKTLTMMAWVKDAGNNKPLTELLAKGDNHVLQLVKGKQLTFFAGGWGRGDITVDLPANWLHHWHHVAGVCNGKQLRVFIDGKLAGVTELEEMIDLNVAARWTIGSNEEFPLDRTFSGDIKGVRIYAAALSDDNVQQIFSVEKSK